MSDERITADGSLKVSPLKKQTNAPSKIGPPNEEVTEALARVQGAVADRNDSELRESLEGAIEAIDSARETPDVAGSDQLGTIADALEGALEELEGGRVANLLPVIEQAQSITQLGSLGL